MKVIVAKTAGFCWGVKRAMDAVLEASTRSNNPRVQTLGPLIHNPQALALIENRGVSVVTGPEQVQSGTVVIRAHGIPIQALRGLKERQSQGELDIVNATCPEVAKVHNKIKKWSPKGYFTIILGSKGHPESIAHRSFAENGSIIISTMEEAKQLTAKELSRCLIVAQTTYTVKDFHTISSYIEDRATDCIVENTICEDTWMRQDEAESLSKRVDYVIVVGGKESSNTKHLAELAQRYGKPVQYVETAQEIDMSKFTGSETVGVLAGASTPTWLVDEVVDYLEETSDNFSRWTKTLTRAFTNPLVWGTSVFFSAFGVSKFLDYPDPLFIAISSGFFIISMYLSAPYLEPLGLGVKGPAQAKFLEAHRRLILNTSMIAALISIVSASEVGFSYFICNLIVFSTSLFYRIGISGSNKRTFSLRSIPGSKDFFVPLSIAILMVTAPSIQYQSTLGIQHGVVFMIIFTLALSRTFIYDLRDMQKDQVLGKETLPIALGKIKSLWLIGVMLLSSIILALTVNPYLSVKNWILLDIILVLALCYPMFYWWFYHHRFSAGKPWIDVRPEFSFALLGLLALI